MCYKSFQPVDVGIAADSLIFKSREEFIRYPIKRLVAGANAIIQFRGPNGEFWANEFHTWDGGKWICIGHSDPAGDEGEPGVAGIPGCEFDMCNRPMPHLFQISNSDPFDTAIPMCLLNQSDLMKGGE